MSEHEGPWSRRPPPPSPPAKPRPWHVDRRVRIVLGLVVCVGFGVWLLAEWFPGGLAPGRDWASISYRFGLLVLVAASLFSRRLKLTETIRYMLIWAAIVGSLALGYAYRGELGDAALRVRAELLPGYAVPAGQRRMVLTQGADGAFSVVAQVNGQPVRFIIDTGASDIVLSPSDAQRLGVDPEALHFTDISETANGLGRGAPYVAASLSVGPAVFADVPMSINRAPMSASLLGMAFLRRLESFEVRSGRMVLTWRG
jgi:aspartyl protease family protein